MEKLMEFVNNMAPRQLILIGGGGLGILLAIILSVALLSQQRLALLYGNLSPEDSTEIVKVLEQLGEPYQISDSNTILVASEKVARLRITLAERSLPSSGSIAGYELFDKEQGFGTSNFVQQVNHLRALEGELAKTIMSIDTIRNARIHLVLPKRELFNRNQREPRASVVLTLVRSQTLPKEQISAIRSLIASSVSNLSIGNISVVDSKGRLLARGSDGDDGEFYIGGSSADEIRVSYETRLASDLQALVESIVGFNNARVEVSAEMDFSQTLIQEEIFDPEGQVLLSSEELTELNEDTNILPDGQVTVTNNLPGNEPNPDGRDPGSHSTSSRNQVVNNYQNSSRSVSRTIQPGQIQRLSVAVLVDGIYVNDENDNRVYTPRPEQELAEIERLVRSAIGFDATVRQDSVEVVNLRFATDLEFTDLLAENKILGIEISRIESLVELIVLSIVALVVFLLVLRPLLIRALSGGPASSRRDVLILADGTIVDKKTGEPVGPVPDIYGATDDESATPTATTLLGTIGGGGELINLNDVDAQIHQTLSKQLNDVAKRFPNETGNVVKNWLLES